MRLRHAIPLGFVLLRACTSLRGDLLEEANRALLWAAPDNSYGLRLSGTIDLEGYFFNLPPPALIEANGNGLFNPRLTLFADAHYGSQLSGSIQLRVDRGFDPTDGGLNLRADEYYLRVRPFGSNLINLEAGKFATVVGNWVPRHYSWENPFINAPLVYENLTGIWDSEAATNIDTLLFWGHVGRYRSDDYSDKYLRLPVIWGPSYASGLAAFGSIQSFDYAFELKNSALASRPEAWDFNRVGFSDPTFSGRLGYRLGPMWTLGFSGSSGSYLVPEAQPTLPLGQSLGDYREMLLGQDIAFAWHHLQIWAEAYETRFRVPGVGSADVFSYYVEAKYKITPQLFLALRWNQQLFGQLPDEGVKVAWGNDAWRVDSVVGYRFTDYLQAKLQYSYTGYRTSGHNHLLALQLTCKF